ncbi:MAG: hypothetical protein GX273_08410 [Bacteroidales bacterium]|nr:hypothetical protein [Bacteroidales bacterium]
MKKLTTLLLIISMFLLLFESCNKENDIKPNDKTIDSVFTKQSYMVVDTIKFSYEMTFTADTTFYIDTVSLYSQLRSICIKSDSIDVVMMSDTVLKILYTSKYISTDLWKPIYTVDTSEWRFTTYFYDIPKKRILFMLEYGPTCPFTGTSGVEGYQAVIIGRVTYKLIEK